MEIDLSRLMISEIPQDWFGSLDRQLGASLDMLQVAIETATEEMWDHDSDYPPFWRISAHVVFFIDYYFATFRPGVTDIHETYRHPEFLLKYADSYLDDVEDTVVSKEDILKYLNHSRRNLRGHFESDLESQLWDECGFPWLKMTKAELLLYNMRHIMEHTAMLNQILKKHGLPASSWKGISKI
ncbi:MAG: DinB family protein [Promethearchaeota archaeon]